MSRGSANINSPEVIKHFRSCFLSFDTICHKTVADIKTDISKTMAWLQGDRLRHWKQQLRKREEIANQTKRDYNRIRLDTKRLTKSSGIDEKKIWERAKRKKEEAEERIDMIKKWTKTLQHEASRLVGPCTSLTIMLDQITPSAINRLDRMTESLEDYFGASTDAGD